jgi:hypothetical protein
MRVLNSLSLIHYNIDEMLRLEFLLSFCDLWFRKASRFLEKLFIFSTTILLLVHAKKYNRELKILSISIFE